MGKSSKVKEPQPQKQGLLCFKPRSQIYQKTLFRGP